ncbi:hypothetical protein N657DRAFT_606518 [Parathielavia appendiculata]|uniref:Cell wall mannoprotein PIR1-like C-terminal domain-containing protein n=1 Tax=Parathielavia appendiculata TaxID=2587402 RepID=A0AAN6TQ26_9PEZI|nr:hypothetical protein N657DRAFT_606518 [Parathielavia appendiculata]
MKLLSAITVTSALLPGFVVTGRANIPRRKFSLSATDRCFTLSSGEPFIYPAGQLENGQIRLNGSYGTATFILSSGAILDSDGFGCIVTDPPTTQFQCDHGKTPLQGFSIDASNNLLFNGSPSFWACPATDTEYNIYIHPDFGQTKCIPITLKTGACGAPAVTTVWETQTKLTTTEVEQTITVVETASPTCATATSKPPRALSPRSPGSPSSLADPQHWHQFARRGLEEDWNSIRIATNDGGGDSGLNKWVTVNGKRFFPIDASSVGLRVGTSTFYGCTVIVVVGTKGFFFAHLAEESGRGCRPLQTAEDTYDLLIQQIEGSPSLADAGGWRALSPPENEECEGQRWAVIMGSVADSSEDRGPFELKSHFNEVANVPRANIWYTYYARGRGQMEDLPGPEGKAMVTVEDGGHTEDGRQILVLRVYMNHDQPRLELRFTADDGRLVTEGVTVAKSEGTTDGNKVY